MLILHAYFSLYTDLLKLGLLAALATKQEAVRNIGLILNSEFSFRSHTTAIIKSAYYHF